MTMEQLSWQDGSIVATAGSYYRNARYLVAGACFVCGLWCCYDGFVRWPEQNLRYNELVEQLAAARVAEPQDEELVRQLSAKKEELPHHNDARMLSQRVLAVALPVGAVVLLIVWLYKSRGAYRLSERRLAVPGHPPIDFAQIRALDKTLWDRKGIVYVEYQIAGTDRTARATLDDFVYQAAPTRQIVERIDAYLSPPPAETDGQSQVVASGRA